MSNGILPNVNDAAQLARQILGMDESIELVSVLDVKTGQRISLVAKDHVINDPKYDEKMEMGRVWITLASSIFLQLDSVYSETQSIAIFRKDMSQLFVPVPSQSIIIAVRVLPLADVRKVADLIRTFFGL